MKHNRNPLAEAIRYGLGAAAVASLGMIASPVIAQDGDEQEASDLDRIQVTGSRISRPNAENALPVTVLDREQIMASGDVNIADFLRNTSFNSFGSYQSSSGNSFAGASFVNLRGLGQGRTLVLINGRRAPMSPNAGDGQDLNSVPMAAVERIEILSAGASAIYGSDALGGVINIITRTDMDGVEYTVGISRPSQDGGDGKEMNIVYGTTSDRGQLLAGASYTGRDVIMSRDREYFMNPRGGSVYSNNFANAPTNAASARLAHPVFGTAVPGYCHDGTEYFWQSDGICQYEHTMHSADLTSLDNTAIFLRGNYDINDNWRAYFDASVSRVESFGRYAPVPSSPWPGGAIQLPAGTPNHPATPPSMGGYNPYYADAEYAQYADDTLYLLHRFAALGARDSFYESNTYTYVAGAEAQIGIVDLDFGMRYAEQRAIDMGQNYVVGNLAQRHITSGAYNIYDPLNVDPDIAKSMINTISRDMSTVHKEFYASAAFDMFQMSGGAAALVVGGEYREETYQDIYDPLSESGEIVGSAGNSAFGGRDVTSLYAEALFPILDSFELTVAARYDDYSDYGNDFSPMIGLRWQPIDSLTFRASYGEGFRAPSLRLVTLQPSFSAVSTSDPATCVMLTGNESCNTQISTYSVANPNLESEQSEQFGAGVVWEPTNWLEVALDYYNIEITNSISSVSALTVANCLRGTGLICPPGLSVFPQGTTLPAPHLGLGAQFDPATGGIVNAQSGFANLGMVETDGYDLSVSTNFDFGSMGYLQSQLQLSYVNSYKVNGGSNIAGQDIYTPNLRGGLSNVWSMGDWSASWVMSYVKGWPSYVNVYLGGIDGYADRLGSWITHDLQVAYEAPWNATITLGVNNVGDKDPVIDEVWGPEFDLYDPWGRVPYVRYTQRF